MNLKTKIFNCSLLVSCFAAASAFAQDTSDSVSVEQKQQSFLEKLEEAGSNTQSHHTLDRSPKPMRGESGYHRWAVGTYEELCWTD